MKKLELEELDLSAYCRLILVVKFMLFGRSLILYLTVSDACCADLLSVGGPISSTERTSPLKKLARVLHGGRYQKLQWVVTELLAWAFLQLGGAMGCAWCDAFASTAGLGDATAAAAGAGGGTGSTSALA